MSIKFEHVNGTLCRMVEQPCPHCGSPEIIATPVVEGSTGWALYHAIDGKIVTMDGCVIYKIHDGKLWECFPDDSNEWRVVADDGIRYWLKYIHDKTGWQIYTEPEQEPIAETTPCPACHGTGFVDSTFMDEVAARSSCSCDALSKKSSHKPEPDARQKTPIINCADCAIQCKKQSSRIDHCVDYVPKKPEPAYQVKTVDVSDMEFGETNVLSITDEKHTAVIGGNLTKSDINGIIRGLEKKQPETKPKPTYKVGDWVETNKQHHVKITEFPAKHYKTESKVYECYNLSSNKQHLIEEREIVRKLAPSEVRVKITMEGTIHKLVHGANNTFFVLDPAQEKGQLNPVAKIPFAMLDTQTLELVESLLKAQENTNG